MADQKQEMMMHVLTEEARIRLGAIAAANPQKAERLENIILTNAQRGAF